MNYELTGKLEDAGFPLPRTGGRINDLDKDRHLRLEMTGTPIHPLSKFRFLE
jgi:hypothetical protein